MHMTQMPERGEGRRSHAARTGSGALVALAVALGLGLFGAGQADAASAPRSAPHAAVAPASAAVTHTRGVPERSVGSASTVALAGRSGGSSGSRSGSSGSRSGSGVSKSRSGGSYGGGSSYHSGSSSSGGGSSNVIGWLVGLGFLGVVIWLIVRGVAGSGDQ